MRSPTRSLGSARWPAGWGLLLGLALIAGPRSAHAGHTAHLLTEEATILPEGEVELEQWVWVVHPPRAFADRPVGQWVWWAPVISVSPHLELSAPVELAGTDGALGLATMGVRARLRLRPRLEDDGFQPLIRLAYIHALSARRAPELQLNLVATYGSPLGPRLTANLGAQLALPRLRGSADPVSLQGSASLAGSWPLPWVPSLRVAGEGLLEVGAPGPRLRAGPTLSWSHGPLWITAGALFGLTDATPSLLTKVLWGILL